MANVAVAITMEPTYLPFERTPDNVALWTAIPRGLRGFVVEFGTVTAKPVNDTLTLALTATLPQNFAYVFADIALSVRGDTASDWDSEYSLNLQRFYQGDAHGIALAMNWSFDFATMNLDRATLGQGHTAIQQRPTFPMWAPSTGAGIGIVINAFNSAAAVAAVGNVSAYINFWEFDLEQIRKYPINSPFPVHVR